MTTAAALTGTVFDIREFTVHDGPGIRTTLFLKGCPLRCAWCHNPEGIAADPQTFNGPLGQRIVGCRYTVEALLARLEPQLSLLAVGQGGITFSGGEPLAQAAFAAAVADRLRGTHLVLDTSGYADAADFVAVASRVNLVLFDLKLADPTTHRRYTGVDNAAIWRNLRLLPGLGVVWRVRIPLVPGVTDTTDNLTAIARELDGRTGFDGVELLPYNRVAGAKYAPLGRPWAPTYDEQRPVNPDLRIFHDAGLKASLRC